ncbi:hypothetical protein AC739_07400 [Planococcus glaciei]|uniref:hypothetical protein n=1 Tax=Planococcus glaciei TaxID=459472 RepID=UPI0003DF08FC|nr:hypothetical protein [Planococcus glaciei]ETP68453.1 hypothetical protein G159_12185 [Planococcus glaciei CHR43]KOF10804.1 hypothetical protein AC739_07400 [Planococcus glaciei]
MARGRGLLIAGLAAGAYSYFKKPENREKATVAFNNAKTKVNSFMESQNLDKLNKSEAVLNTTDSREDEKVTEATKPGVQYYNENAQSKDSNTKLSSNDTSWEKAENTDSLAPEQRINTDNL